MTIINMNFSKNIIDFHQPFAIIKRKQDQDALIFRGEISFLNQLADIPRKTNSHNGEEVFDTISAIPFSQIRERGFEAAESNLPVSCLKIENQQAVSVDELLNMLPDEVVDLNGGITYDSSKEDYENMVKKIIEDEIGNGEGANFVIPRTGRAKIADMSAEKPLSIFKNFLRQEIGSHWTFIFFDGEKYLLGASPEAHISIKGGRVKMHPISGTFRKKGMHRDMKKLRKELLGFLTNPKEVNELFMVVDEELKMMANICSEGGMIIGPLLKEMTHLIHTEYLLSGKSNKDLIDILRQSMFAATVTGSPLENACKIIHRYEKNDRRFYSSCLALIGQDEEGAEMLDSTILIRTTEISKQGDIIFGVGATLVRDSDPADEVAETEAKIEAVSRGILSPQTEVPDAVMTHFEEDDEVLEILAKRNQRLSKFWFFNQEDEDNVFPALKDKNILIIDNEDDFCHMMKHVITAMGAQVKIIRFDQYEFEKSNADLTIVGPGTGNPNEADHSKMQKVMAITKSLLDSGNKFMAICLGHQFLCKALGFEVSKKQNPSQGVQELIDLFGKKQRVGFYNTFCGKYNSSISIDDIEVAYDASTNEIHALRSTHFAGVQFHPESILTQNGYAILAEMLSGLLT